MTELSTTSEQPIELKTDFLSRPLFTAIDLDWEKVAYILLIGLAIVTRFWDLGSRVMSHDESLHTQFSYQFYNGEGYNHTPLMHGPFLFHATAATYWLFGDNDYTARIPVAILGVILVAMPYLLRPWLGRVGALFTGFFFLISPYIMYYSRYIRHDILVITWAMIVVIGMWYYLRERQEKYLWVFTVGTVLMFSTKEVSFIYVAIFGSFLMVRLLPQLWQSSWLQKVRSDLRTPILVILIGVLLIGGGFVGQHLVANGAEAVATPEATEGFAADPNADTAIDAEPEVSSAAELALRWTQIVGIVVLGAGLFLAARAMRPHIDNYPEFDLIILFATFILPLVSPLLTEIAGWNPRDYTINRCVLEGQESMSGLQLMVARLSNSTCWSAFLTSGMVRSGLFLILALVVAILVGLWWNRRRWLIAAAIFHSIFFVLYTSVFTNPGGWASGMIGSLGYWLEQQGVQRGSQPPFYYFFVVPFYEFLPLIFALAATRLWLKQKRLNKVVGYWLTVILISLLVYSLANWLFNRTAVAIGEPTTNFPGLVAGLLVLGVGVLFWFFVRRGQLLEEYGLRRNFQGLVSGDALCEFVPFLVWWLVLTWVAYSVAGEKMPWLSTHFVIPMALLSGWYFNEKLRDANPRWLSRSSALLLGLTVALIVAVALALGPLLLGQVQFGNQQLTNLNYVGRFLGSLLVAGIIFYFWRQLYERLDGEARQRITVLSVLAVLALLTIRFTYMANFPNANSAREFMVYAHGAPATKSVVLDQIEELSMRLHGDKSIRVAFGGSGVPWPFTWYLREYPNR
ncbi:MAG TPA: flippase activity-associated protein Agl23, partial [Anaerolineae bacterium]